MAAPSDAPQVARRVAIPRPGKGAVRFLVGTAIGIVLVVAGVVWLGQSYAGRILPGVSIGSVDVSGLTPAQAQAALDSAFGGLEQGSVTVRTPATPLVIPFGDLGRHVDNARMIDAAMAAGHGGTDLDEALAVLRGLLRPVEVPVAIDYDHAKLDAALSSLTAQSRREPVDASLEVVDFRYLVGGQVDGVEVDTTAVAPTIDAALRDPSSPTAIDVTASSTVIAPTTSDTDVERAMAAAERMAAPITLTRGSKSWTITRTRIRTWISFGGAGADLAPQVYASKIPAALKNARKALSKPATEARYLRTRSGKVFGVSASSAGRGLDVQATTTRILGALQMRAAGDLSAKPIKLPTMAVAPKLSTGEATKTAPLVSLLGTWTTYYQPSAHNGFSANITVPARKLDGVVVLPGQLFDFWGRLGEVSFRTGYRLGGAIVGGHSVEGKALAGGICAASTTLFNAAARSGLEIVSRQPHWYYITRYPLGLDATVSGSQSMRFRNDTSHPILIKSFASPGIVTFQIWSLPNGRTTTWSAPTVRNVVRRYDTVQYTSSLPRGERKRIEWPVDGKDVWVTRTVRDANGRIIHRETFVSHYHRMVGITLIGK